MKAVVRVEIKMKKIEEKIPSEYTDAEIYEEEYRRTMRAVAEILHRLGERGLSFKVDRQLSKHINEGLLADMNAIRPSHVKRNDYYLPFWENYFKRIPRQGLNNLTKRPQWYHGSSGWSGKPTLPRRLERLRLGGIYGTIRLPFFYYHMDIRADPERQSLPRIQELTKLIIERLEDLYDKMDTVTALTKLEIKYWKEKLREAVKHVQDQSHWVGLELIQEAGFEVVVRDE